jgi:hypothetical protein
MARVDISGDAAASLQNDGRKGGMYLIAGGGRD